MSEHEIEPFCSAWSAGGTFGCRKSPGHEGNHYHPQVGYWRYPNYAAHEPPDSEPEPPDTLEDLRRCAREREPERDESEEDAARMRRILRSLSISDAKFLSARLRSHSSEEAVEHRDLGYPPVQYLEDSLRWYRQDGDGKTLADRVEVAIDKLRTKEGDDG